MFKKTYILAAIGILILAVTLNVYAKMGGSSGNRNGESYHHMGSGNNNHMNDTNVRSDNYNQRNNNMNNNNMGSGNNNPENHMNDGDMGVDSYNQENHMNDNNKGKINNQKYEPNEN